MKNKLSNKQRVAILLPLFFVIIISLIAVAFIFNNKEINNLTDKCFANGGKPVVEMSTLTLGYSFSCATLDWISLYIEKTDTSF